MERKKGEEKGGGRERRKMGEGEEGKKEEGNGSRLLNSSLNSPINMRHSNCTC